MSIIGGSVTIYSPDGGSLTLDAEQARYRVYLNPGEWSFSPPPPPDWDREIPRYRATRDLHPSPNSRHRFESPFSTVMDPDVWQQSTAPIAAGETIETLECPMPR